MKKKKKKVDHKQEKRILMVVFCAAILFIIMRRAWVSDDAFITLRSIDNFVSGFGLTWNATERVQTYTHPLWMFLLMIPYFLTREPFFTTLGVGVLASLAALIVVYRRFSDQPAALITVAGALVFSRAFIDYSTSGLENPLSHLIVVIFFSLFITQQKEWKKRDLIRLSLVASLGVLNRMDLLLVFAPCFIWVLFREKKIINLWYVVLGQLPFLAWEVFSLIYYGFLVPNTAYAKMPAGIPRHLLLQQGFTYFLHSIINDPVTIFMIFLPLLMVFIKKDIKNSLMAAGCGLYLLYVIWIGGDFMEGRFFTVPLIISLLIYLNFQQPDPIHHYAVGVFLLLLGLSIPINTLTLDITNEKYLPAGIAPSGIADERFVYHRDWGLSLAARSRNNMKLSNKWIKEGLALREQNTPFSYQYSIGMVGYYAGSAVHITDVYTLADPLRSKLPVESPTDWRIGHFQRSMPEGYDTSLAQGKNLIADPDLKEYYEYIRIITRGEIFAWERLKVIFEMQLGKYNHLLEDYIEKIQT